MLATVTAPQAAFRRDILAIGAAERACHVWIFKIELEDRRVWATRPGWACAVDAGSLSLGSLQFA
jgi:hypothetical protein